MKNFLLELKNSFYKFSKSIKNRFSKKQSFDFAQDEPATEIGTQDTDNVSESKLEVKQISESIYQKKWFKPLMIVIVILGIFLSIAGVLGIYSYSVARELMTQGNEAEVLGQSAYAAFKAQNLPEAENNLKALQEKVSQINLTYKKLKIYKSVPIARKYYIDGQAGLYAADRGLNAALTAVEAITPYADVLGFTGEESFEGGTAENRVKLILQTLEKVTPQLDSIEADLEEMQKALAEIDPNDYPESIKGKAIRSNISQGKIAADTAVTALTEFRPIIEKLPDIAGATGERRKYLVLFQNDNELRPTGGFLTAYAVIFMEDGVVTPEKSDDIYELDKKFTKRIDIPEELGRYLTTEKYWNLRDMNISPDFKESMDQFLSNYKEVRGEPDDIDGVIAVDTEFLTDLVKIVGPIEIPGYGTFSAEIDSRCDCPQIIYALSEIITKPTPYIREDRKGILGPLMKAILGKIYSSPKVYMSDLFASGLKSVAGRDFQAFFFNEDWQNAIEAIDAGGRLEKDANAQDFVAIVDANLGGAKSNLFIDYSVNQEVSLPENGMIQKTVTITYKNDRKADNCNLEAGQLCLNSTLRDWFRLYVPAGAELVESQGFTQDPKVYEENGFTVFDSFFILEPMSQAKVKLTYTVPYTDSQTYKVKYWKQGGVSPFKVVMDVDGNQEEVEVAKDIVYQTSF